MDVHTYIVVNLYGRNYLIKQSSFRRDADLSLVIEIECILFSVSRTGNISMALNMVSMDAIRYLI